MDSKKMYVLISMGILIILVMGVFCTESLHVVQKKKQETNITEDEKKFKKEYEDLNGKQREGKDYKNQTIEIEEENKIVYASQDDILKLFENGTGVIYFGFPDCPWCRNAVPVLIEAAKEEDIPKIYYYNAVSERDVKKLDNGEIKTEEEGSTFYRQILDKLGDKASSYEGLEDDRIKRLYFPTVVFIKNGEIISLHEGTVSSQKDPLVALTEEEKLSLKNIYVKGMEDTFASVCDEKC